MRKIYATLALLLVLFHGTFAQLERVGIPISWTQSLSIDVDNEMLAQLDVETLLSEDATLDQDRSSPFRFAFARQVNLDLANSGTWINLPNGDRLWMLSVEYPEAQSISVTLDNLNLPRGGKLYIYSEDHQDYLGPITASDNRDFELGLPHIKGSRIIAEYYEPNEVRGQSGLNITYVAGSYKNIVADGASSIACHALVDLNQASLSVVHASSSVVRILIDHGQRYATGVLVNNAVNDGTPYILMAADAILGTPGSFVFQFGYNSGCLSGGVNCTEQSICGAELLLQDAQNGIALLQLMKTPNSDWGAFYSGWRLNPNGGDVFRCLQHAKGLPQSISIYAGELIPVVYESRTMHGLDVLEQGQTDAGSLGSPLFDSDLNLIGLFRGGNTQCIGNTGVDRFVLLSQFWEGVRHFLDPENRDSDKISGFLPPQLDAKANTLNAIVVYPNPTSECFSLNCEIDELMRSIELVNAQGVLIRTFEQTENMVIGDLPVGVYTVLVHHISGTHALPLFISGQ